MPRPAENGWLAGRGLAYRGGVLSRAQVEEFAERGFLVLPGVVPRAVVDAAARAIDELVEREPPGTDVRGPFNYFPEAARAPELAALLTGSPAFGLAEALTGAGTLEVPWQVQVISLTAGT